MFLSNTRILVVMAVWGCLLSAAPASQALSANKKPAVPSPVSIQPHRVVYNLSLGQHKNTTDIEDVSGTITMEWGDACDSWVIHQKSLVQFSYASGDESTLTSHETSWESKDGARYSFSVRHQEDGGPEQEWQGSATIDSTQQKAKFKKPKPAITQLSPDTLLPLQHTLRIIENALAGEKFFSASVFSGNDSTEADTVSTFIGERTLSPTPIKADKYGLLTSTYWPVHLAYFKGNTETGSPDFEVDLDLHINGIARNMSINFGDYTIRGTIREISSLPTKKC